MCDRSKLQRSHGRKLSRKALFSDIFKRSEFSFPKIWSYFCALFYNTSHNHSVKSHVYTYKR